MRRLGLLGLLGSALYLAACGSDDEDTQCPETGGAGTLQVNVTGLPGSTAARQVLTGRGESHTIDGTQSLQLPAGSYTLSREPVAVSHPLFRTAYRPESAPSPVCVREGKSAELTVTFAPIPSSGKLWTSNGSGGSAPLLGFSADVLGASGSPAATVAATTGGSEGSAFDRDGNLWVVGGTTGDAPVLMYAASTLGSSGTKTAAVTLKGGPLEGGFPRARVLAFDPSGNLWVSVGFNDKIVRYNRDQLAVSGSPTPAAEFTGLNGPSGLAFDAQGNLWVAFSGNDRVGRYNASRLSTSSTAAPDLVIEALTPPPVIGTLSAPSGLAFDVSGNLWVNFNGTLARLTPSDQGGSGTVIVTPAVQIGLTVSALPDGLVFDESGNLWFAHSVGKFGRLNASMLTSSGEKDPDIVITSPDVGYSGWFSFYPAPANLPLYHRLP
jgi:streptogramin lyase